jgi:hypothetical protein
MDIKISGSAIAILFGSMVAVSLLMEIGKWVAKKTMKINSLPTSAIPWIRCAAVVLSLCMTALDCIVILGHLSWWGVLLLFIIVVGVQYAADLGIIKPAFKYLFKSE